MFERRFHLSSASGRIEKKRRGRERYPLILMLNPPRVGGVAKLT
jgi:hypothetical protein